MNRIIFFHDFPLIYSYVKWNPNIVVQPYPRDHGFNKLDLHYFKDAFDQVSTYLTNRFLKKKDFPYFIP